MKRVTADLARELCARHGIKAFIASSIVPLGGSYVITLEAIAVADGGVISRTQVQADRKEDVLRQLGAAAASLRADLGESLPSLQKFDAPIEQATTSSLEALRAYAKGVERTSRGDYRGALALYRRAIDLDADFALAYQALARGQFNVSPSDVMSQAATRAFELRARTTEDEKLRIASFYHQIVTRNLNEAIDTADVWSRTYPNQWQPWHALSDLYYTVGRYAEGADAAREAIRLNPDVAPTYSNLAGALVALNRFAEAQRVYGDAQARHLRAPEHSFFLFWVHHWLGDPAARDAQIDVMDRSHQPQFGLVLRSHLAAFEGRWREAQGWAARARRMADQTAQGVSAAQLAAIDAPVAAALADCTTAATLADHGLTSSWPPERAATALALAMCGDERRASAAVAELQSFRGDTLLQRVWIPTVDAALDLHRGHPDRALQTLSAVGAYEPVVIWPRLLRGQALIRTGASAEAMREFADLRDSPGRHFWSFPVYPVSQLWLARAARLAGDQPASARAYEALFALWEHADVDFPLLVEARREARQLRSPRSPADIR